MCIYVYTHVCSTFLAYVYVCVSVYIYIYMLTIYVYPVLTKCFSVDPRLLRSFLAASNRAEMVTAFASDEEAPC